MTWPITPRASDDLHPGTTNATDTPVLALAPMQDVTDHAFWKLMASYGGADIYYTEYFRVHADSRLEKWILQSIDENPTGRPVVGHWQLDGEGTARIGMALHRDLPTHQFDEAAAN